MAKQITELTAVTPPLNAGDLWWVEQAGTAKKITLTQLVAEILSSPELKSYSLTKHIETSSSGTLTIDLALGNVVDYTFTENVTTVTINSPPASGLFGECWLRLIQHASAAKTITWASKYHFPAGVDHIMTTTLSAVDLLHLTTIDGGTTWLCTFALDLK